jgi:hypothetical protein
MTYEEKYKLHNQLREYAETFTKQVKQDLNIPFDTNIIPIIFIDEPSNRFAGFDLKGEPHKISVGVTLDFNKQSVIKIFDCENLPIEELEQTVRHECIHYILWTLDLKYNDDTAVFHLLCEKYEAAADEPMSVEEQELYDKYKSLTKAYSQYGKICKLSQLPVPQINFDQLLLTIGNEKTQNIFNDFYKNVMTKDFLDVIRKSYKLLDRQ